MRVLFLTTYPVEAANTRYRVQQFFPYLQSVGIECELTSFLSRELFFEFYQPRQKFSNLLGMVQALGRRLGDVLQARHYDVVFVEREALLLGPPVLEWLLARVMRQPVVFDFDDAIFLPAQNSIRGSLATWLKYPAKTARTLALSTQIIAGNEYLAAYAKRYNPSVTILPTVVDVTQYAAAAPVARASEDLVIGWIGTHSTAPYLEIVAPALTQLARQHRFVFRVIGAGRDVQIPGVVVENRPWKLATEIADFRDLDIGIYPIDDNEWSQGKCAFKAIQYLAAGVPCVASPVGMTKEVITDQVTGLFADTAAQWEQALEKLLKSTELRQQFSEAGQLHIARAYSLQVHAPRLAAVLRAAAGH